MLTFYENEVGAAQYDQEHHLVQVNWKKVKTISFQEYQDIFNSCTNLMAQKKGQITNYMSDIRMQGVVSPEYRKWFQDVVIPSAVSSGLKKSAVIFDGNVFQKYYLNNIMNFTKKYGLQFKFFSSRDEAIEWMMKA